MKRFFLVVITAFFTLMVNAQEWMSLTEILGTVRSKIPNSSIQKEVGFYFDEMPFSKFRITKKKNDFDVRFSEMPGGKDNVIIRSKHVLVSSSDGHSYTEESGKALTSDKDWRYYDSSKPVYPTFIYHLQENDVQVSLTKAEINLLKAMKSYYAETCRKLISEYPANSPALDYDDYIKFTNSKFSPTGLYPISQVKNYVSALITIVKNKMRAEDIGSMDEKSLSRLSQQIFSYSRDVSAIPSANTPAKTSGLSEKIKQIVAGNFAKKKDIKPRPQTESGWTLVKSNKFVDQDIVCEHWRKGNNALRIFKKSNGDFATFAENDGQVIPSDNERTIGEYRRTVSDDGYSLVVYGGFANNILSLSAEGKNRPQIKINDNKRANIIRVSLPNEITIDKVANDNNSGETFITWNEFVNGFTKEQYAEAERTIFIYGTEGTKGKKPVEIARQKVVESFLRNLESDFYYPNIAVYEKGGKGYLLVKGETDHRDQKYAIDIESGNTYRLFSHKKKNSMYDIVGISLEKKPKMKLLDDRLYYCSDGDSIISVENDIVKYANGDYIKFDGNSVVSGRLHRNGGIAKISTKEDFVLAEIQYPDKRIYRGTIWRSATDFGDDKYSVINSSSSSQRWLTDKNLTPYKGSMEMADGTIVQIVDGMTLAEKKAAEAEAARKKAEAERQKELAAKKLRNYYINKYGYYPGDDDPWIYNILAVGHPMAAIIEYTKGIARLPVPELVGNYGKMKKYLYKYNDMMNNRQTIIVYTTNGIISSVYR